jgi:hypothetical protein
LSHASDLSSYFFGLVVALVLAFVVVAVVLIYVVIAFILSSVL